MKTQTIKDLKGFGRAVRQARIRKGWTQQKLGKMCDIRGETVSKIELGDTGPKPQTVNRLEKALGVSAKRFLDLGPGGEVMEGLQELTDQVRLLVEKIGKEQAPANPVLPDASEFTGSKAQIIKVVSHLQNEIEELKNGVANPKPEKDELESEKETPDQIKNKLLTEHEDLKKEGTFKNFDDFWSGQSKEERRFKAQLLVDLCNVCDDLELDAFEEVKDGFLTGKATRAEAMRDVIMDFCTDDISRDDADKALDKYLKPADPGDDEDEHFADTW